MAMQHRHRVPSKYFWPLGRHPDDHRGLSDLGL